MAARDRLKTLMITGGSGKARRLLRDFCTKVPGLPFSWAPGNHFTVDMSVKVRQRTRNLSNIAMNSSKLP
jgi:hypothetical protein